MKALRLMGERSLGTHGYALCTGVVGLPARRCCWRIIARRSDRAVAARVLSKLPAADGRAIVLLDTRALVIVNRAGQVLQDNRRAR